MPDSFSTSCRHKRDAIFEIQFTEMRHGSLDMKLGTIWLPADAELPVRIKRIIASEKPMLIVFWGIHAITHDCWLPEDSTVDSSFL
jgi:hypothetical protein